jgi:transcriptional regulator with XRE-family HTH domain
LAWKKSQREIAAEVGYDKPNMLSMIKYGDSRVPLDKIPPLAKALEVEVAHLFRLALEQYWPELHKTLADVGIDALTKGEAEVIKIVRKSVGVKP